MADVSEKTTAAVAAAVENGLLHYTPDEIDAEIAFYQNALACAKQAQEVATKYRDRLVELTDRHGTRPPHAEQSVRLAGRRNTVTVTRGTTVTINDAAVEDLKQYVDGVIVGDQPIFARLFASQIKYTLVEGARDLLKKLQLPRRTEEKTLSLFGRCIDLKTKAPTVKVEIIQPEKPAGKKSARKPRSGKAAA